MSASIIELSLCKEGGCQTTGNTWGGGGGDGSGPDGLQVRGTSSGTGQTDLRVTCAVPWRVPGALCKVVSKVLIYFTPFIVCPPHQTLYKRAHTLFLFINST